MVTIERYTVGDPATTTSEGVTDVHQPDHRSGAAHRASRS